MKKIIIILLISIAIMGCSRITEGEIIKKEFEPAHTDMVLVPITMSNGKTSTTSLVPMMFYYPDAWGITIQKFDTEKSKYKHRTIWVSKYVYDESVIGGWYEITSNDMDEQIKIKQ